MGPLVGIVRIGLSALILLVGAVLILIAGFFPMRMGHAPVAGWIAVGMARAFGMVANVRIRGHHADQLRGHAGFVFPNHLSYLDIIALMCIMPVRFLSAAEVLNYPVIGWIARTIGTVFVRRDDPGSRQQARDDIVMALKRSSRPPIVLFPEGRLGRGDRLFPFRHGAFEIAVEHQVAYLPCALHYSEPEIAIWRGVEGEALLPALWRLVTFWGPVVVDVYFFEPVHPEADADPEALAAAAAEMIGKRAIHSIDWRQLA